MNHEFIYQGPVDSSVTLKVDGQDMDVLLFRGASVALPPQHEYVKTLIALGYLVAQTNKPNASQAEVSTTIVNEGVK